MAIDMPDVRKVYLGLGSNLGDRRANLGAAVDGLARFPATRVVKSAGVYETDPVGGPGGQGRYLNSAVMVETGLAPLEMLARIHGLEREIGRVRDGNDVRWGPRPIDVDILLWEGVVMDDPVLTIPHPLLARREFVLRPLADLDSRLRHPVLGASVGELLESFSRKIE